MHSLDLTALLAPTSTECFLHDFWERQPLIVRGDAGRFDDLFGLDDIEAVVAGAPDDGTRPGAYCVRVDNDGRSTEYPLRNGRRDRRSVTALAQAFDAGFTIVASGLAHVHPAISTLCAAVESDLQHPLGCNLYLTPPGAQGFPPHRDVSDTFFLQVEGAKDWSLWAPTHELPRDGDPALDPAIAMRPPDIELRLEAGDVLYLPRGWVHAGSTSDELSLHLTLGVRATTWTDLLIEQVNRVARDDRRFRRALPLADTLRLTREALTTEARELLHALVDDLADDALQDLLVRRIESRSPTVEANLRSTIARSSHMLDTVVERRDGLDPIVSGDESGCRMTFVGGFVEGPPIALESFRFIARQRRFAIADVPGLPESAQLDLVGELVLRGLLRPAAA